MKNNYNTTIYIVLIVALIAVTAMAGYFEFKNNEANSRLDAVQNELLIKSNEVIQLNETLNETNENLEKVLLELDGAYSDIVDVYKKFERVKWATNFDISEDEIRLIAKTVLGEAGNCTTLEQSAVIWCILNRVDAGKQTITQVITAPNQFHGYNPKWVVKPDIYALTIDVLTRWQLEKLGVGDVGRTLPKDYKWFRGDGKHNYFRNAYDGDYEIWDWNCLNPYS